MSYDPEILAISKVFEAFKDLNYDQRKRIVNWVNDKFGLVDDREKAPTAPDKKETPVESKKSILEKEPVQTEKPVGGRLKQYKSLADIFSAAIVKKNPARVLLAASYLQVKNNLKEISGREINAILKDIGSRVINISVTINALTNKKPPLMLKIRAEGASPKAKHKYKVTPEGINTAINYLINNKG